MWKSLIFLFEQIAVSTNKVHQEDFLKAAVLNRSAEGAMTDSFWKEYLP